MDSKTYVNRGQWMEYTTFTDRAPEDWAEIWGERNFVLYTITYEYGWLIVTIVGYSACMYKYKYKYF